MTVHDPNYPFSNLFDSDLTSGVRSIAATPTDKFSLTVRFPQKVHVGAVLIYTDETRMNSGGFKVLVYDSLDLNDANLECPSLEGVGSNAIGGVFNCGL